MQSSLLVSVDMMPTGLPVSASAAKTEQDGIFSAHLAAASQVQATTAQQMNRATNQENTSSPVGQIPDSVEKSTIPLIEAIHTIQTAITSAGQTPVSDIDNAAQSQLFDALNTIEPGSTSIEKKLTSASGDKTNKEDAFIDDLPSDVTLTSSAGAANVGMIPLYWTGADLGIIPNQNIAKTMNNESTLSRMLDAIASVANGVVSAPQTNSSFAQAQTEATVVVKADATTIVPDPAVQTFTMEVKQPLPLASQPTVAPDTTEALNVPNAGFSEKNGIARIDNFSLQPQITVSLVSDAMPAAKAVSLTEKTTIVSPSATAQTQSSAIETPAQQSQAQQSVDQVVQNKYGQIITIYQSSESQEKAAATAVDSKSLTTVTNSQKMDANNTFIQSQLHNDAPKDLEKESGSQQQNTTAKDNQQKGTNTAKTLTNVVLQPEQLTPQPSLLTVGTENQAFIFPLQQASTLLASTPLADSLLRLPSGFIVPGETVVDQMISHFSVNNRLASGTVNLKLHPQELGELRMEIKISQDTIKAHIIAQTPQAQEMITQHLPRLREALEQQGLQLQQIEVTIAANDNTSREQFRGNAGQQQLNQFMHNNRGSQPIFALDTGDETGEVAQITNNLSVMA